MYLDQLDIAGILLKAVPIHAANSDFLKVIKLTIRSVESMADE